MKTSTTSVRSNSSREQRALASSGDEDRSVPSSLAARLITVIRSHIKFHGARPEDIAIALEEARRLYPLNWSED